MIDQLTSAVGFIMRMHVSVHRKVAAVAAAVAFVATFALSARAVIQDVEPQTKEYEIVVIVIDDTNYRVGQRVVLQEKPVDANGYVEVADGVFAEPVDPNQA